MVQLLGKRVGGLVGKAKQQNPEPYGFNNMKPSNHKRTAPVNTQGPRAEQRSSFGPSGLGLQVNRFRFKV